jgi:hypothetical protein
MVTDTHEIGPTTVAVDDGAPPAQQPGATGSDSSTRALGGGPWLVAVVTGVVVVIPLVLALAALRSPRWYPTLDFAMTELRVRDVPTRHAPLVGLAGRLQADSVQGSHPGPLSFWLLWPVYRLLGSSGWALQVATAVINTVALGVALWIGRRRAGVPGLLGLAAGLGLLAHGLGIDRLTEPWNPYMPVLWWVVFLLAAWSVLCDDVPLLLVAVFAGSFCAQTHVSYVGSVGGMLAFLAVVIAVRAWRCDRTARRRLAGWSLGSAGALAVLWLAPVVDELRNSPGNLTIIRETFVNPPEPALGLGRDALEVWASLLDVWNLPRYAWSFDVAPVGSVTAGALLFALWAGAAAVAWSRRRAEPALWRLHVAVAVALALGLVSISRIHGAVFHYLLLWAAGTTVLAIVATVWSGVSLWTRLPVRWRPRWAPATGGAVLVGTLLASTAALTSDAVDAVAPDPVESSLVAHVAPGTIAALRAGRVPGDGPDGRYVVRWSDSLSILPAGYGLVLELERAGFDVGALPAVSTNVVPHRARPDDEATATVLMVRGEAGVSRLRAAADTTQLVEVAYHEPRTPAQVERYDELHADVVIGLRAAGLDDLVATLDARVINVAFDDRVPDRVASAVSEMVRLGQPVAVFVGPPGTAWLEQIDPRLTSF